MEKKDVEEKLNVKEKNQKENLVKKGKQDAVKNSLYIYYMELEQVVMVILILVIVYMLLQMSQQQQQQSTQSDNVVLLRTPYFGYNFGQGPMWRGPRPGGRRRRWRRRGRRFFF